MRYYIDTHILIYMLLETDNLSNPLSDILNDAQNIIMVSTEAVKEAIYLIQIGKVKLKKRFTIEDFIHAIESMNIKIMPYKKEHLLTLAQLPLYETHRDPTDRMLIAQAITERVPIISTDGKFSLYKNLQLVS